MKTKEDLSTEFTTLKVQYKTVYTITVQLDDETDETATIYLKKYDRNLYAAVNKLASAPDPLIAVETFLRGTYIGGDDLETIVNNLDALMACETPIVKIMTKYKATLKKN